MPWLRPAFVGSVLVVLGACSSDPQPAPTCTKFDAACAPLYEATYQQIFDRTLKPTCAKTGVSCHGGAGRQGGLNFDDADRAHALLLERGAVKPGDAECSPMAVRIRADDPNFRMPPGKALDPAEACAIQQWIAAGAKR